jgi:hypothetical protein
MNSGKGCMIEKDFCKKHFIPIVEMGDYDEADIVW